MLSLTVLNSKLYHKSQWRKPAAWASRFEGWNKKRWVILPEENYGQISVSLVVTPEKPFLSEAHCGHLYFFTNTAGGLVSQGEGMAHSEHCTLESSASTS